LGDIKPKSLRKIETLIWQDLFAVARCQLDPEQMADHVLDSIVEPAVLEKMSRSKHALRQHFKTNFDPVLDHTSFFFPGMFFLRFFQFAMYS